MAPRFDSIQDNAEEFARRYGCRLDDKLGWGLAGTVFLTSRQSALKILKWRELYERERDTYLRLLDRNIQTVCGCNVPCLLGFDDELWAVEMTVVLPPYVLDFAGAFVEQRPEYPDEVLEEWLSDKREQFGDQWPLVRRIIYAFEQLGIYLSDLNPNNIRLIP